MTDHITTVPEPTKRPLRSRINKARVAKVAAVTGGVALAAVALKRKFDCSCDVSASAKVETVDQPES